MIMKRWMWAVLVLGLAVTAIGQWQAGMKAQAAAWLQAGTIVTTGRAEVSAAPDRATLVTGVSVLAPSAAAAQAEAAELMIAVQEALAALGIPAKDIQTRAFQVGPEYEYVEGRQVLRGYRATHDLYIQVHEIALLGSVLDAVVKSGATRVREVQFGLSQENELMRKALQLAVQDARGRAEALAAGAGIKEIRIVKIQDQSTSRAPVRSEALYATKLVDAGASTPVAGGEVTVRADVSVEFAF
jgi:uncharacterized protein YggE